MKDIEFLNKYDVYEITHRCWRLRGYTYKDSKNTIQVLNNIYTLDVTKDESKDRKDVLLKMVNVFKLYDTPLKGNYENLTYHEEQKRYVVLSNKIPLEEGELGELHVAQFNNWMKHGRYVEPDYTENHSYEKLQNSDFEYCGRVIEKTKKKIWTGKEVALNQWIYEPYY